MPNLVRIGPCSQLYGVQRGTTLIELLFALAMVAVLAAVALITFQEYVSRAQLAAAMAEISPGKQQLDSRLNDGLDAPLSFAISVGLSDSQRCRIQVSASTSGFAIIRCTLRGSAIVSGRTLQWVREPDSVPSGAWHCETDLPLSPLPAACNKLGADTLAKIPAEN